MTSDNELTDRQWYLQQPHPLVALVTFYRRRSKAYSREDAIAPRKAGMLELDQGWYLEQPEPKVPHSTFYSRRNRGYSRHEALNPYLHVRKKDIHKLPSTPVLPKDSD